MGENGIEAAGIYAPANILVRETGKHRVVSIRKAHKILEQSFLRIRHAEDLVTRLIENHADIKVASLLLSLARNFGIKKPEGILLELNISRENMGSFAGLTRETMTRKLAELKEKDIIELIDTKKILLKDLDALRIICLG